MSRSDVVEAGNEDYGLGRGPLRAECSEKQEDTHSRAFKEDQ